MPAEQAGRPCDFVEHARRKLPHMVAAYVIEDLFANLPHFTLAAYLTYLATRAACISFLDVISLVGSGRISRGLGRHAVADDRFHPAHAAHIHTMHGQIRIAAIPPRQESQFRLSQITI